VGKASPNNQTEDSYPGIGVPLTGEDCLAQGASTKQGGRQSAQSHTKEVPQVVIMRHWLSHKANIEKLTLTKAISQDQIYYQSPEQEEDRGF